jgi:hypothetical protein
MIAVGMNGGNKPEQVAVAVAVAPIFQISYFRGLLNKALSLSLYVPSGDKNINKQLFQADRQEDHHRTPGTTAAHSTQPLTLIESSLSLFSMYVYITAAAAASYSSWGRGLCVDVCVCAIVTGRLSRQL